MIAIASVLFIRGQETIQPLIEPSTGNVLLWNGEIYGGDVIVNYGENDTQVLLNRLSNINNNTESTTNNKNDSNDSLRKDIPSIMKSIQGEWAFIYWQVRIIPIPIPITRIITITKRFLLLSILLSL